MGLRVRITKLPLNLRPGLTAMHKVGVLVRDRTVARTRSGRSEDGSWFTGYAASTRKRKDAAGHTGRVDLTDTGQMLDDYDVVDASDRMVRLGFTSDYAERLADIHQQGRGHMPVRRFTGLTRSWIEDIRRVLVDAIKAQGRR